MKTNVLKGAVAGTLGGIAGVVAMTTLQLLTDAITGSIGSQPVRQLSMRGGRHDIARLKSQARRSGRQQSDATILAAERLKRAVLGENISARFRHRAGLALHYAFGAAVGTTYGYAVEKLPLTRVLQGIPFGLVVWMVGEEVALPVLGLSDSPNEYRTKDHLNAMATHALFGVTTELVRAKARRLL
ncbi:MAG: DUF1440 domain-containing protein [Acidobacteria bacterium]|nr:DUF1440 domain-containing protein [Acidobacteriota bacterium]